MMSNYLTISPLPLITEGFLETIYDIDRKIFPEDLWLEPEELWGYFYRKTSLGFQLFAGTPGKNTHVGYVIACAHSECVEEMRNHDPTFPECPDALYLFTVGLVPAAQGKGWGVEAIECLTEQAKLRGYNLLTIHSRATTLAPIMRSKFNLTEDRNAGEIFAPQSREVFFYQELPF